MSLLLPTPVTNVVLTRLLPFCSWVPPAHPPRRQNPHPFSTSDINYPPASHVQKGAHPAYCIPYPATILNLSRRLQHLPMLDPLKISFVMQPSPLHDEPILKLLRWMLSLIWWSSYRLIYVMCCYCCLSDGLISPHERQSHRCSQYISSTSCWFC